MDIDEIKRTWTAFEFDRVEFSVKEEELTEFALACGEAEPRFTDPRDPDFQAVPSFTTKYHGRRMMPKDFPKLSSNPLGIDGGKCVEVHGPIRPGDRLSARSRIHDVYEKTGRSGGMIFVVHRMEFTNQRDELVSIVDWRLIQKSEPGTF